MPVEVGEDIVEVARANDISVPLADIVIDEIFVIVYCTIVKRFGQMDREVFSKTVINISANG